jgi:hypothetical protein
MKQEVARKRLSPGSGKEQGKPSSMFLHMNKYITESTTEFTKESMTHAMTECMVYYTSDHGLTKLEQGVPLD